MTVRVGVIGTGGMGGDHVRTLATSVPGARLTRLFDVDADRVGAFAAQTGAAVAASAEELIESDEVDAVVVASPSAAHTAQVLAAIAVGKPVLCEKPMSSTADEGWPIVAAEAEQGRRLVQLGFMRFYDPGFVELKRVIDSGALGEPRLVHSVHRNESARSTSAVSLIAGSMIHELHHVPWLLDDPIVAIRVESPVAEGLQDPLLATLRLASGVLASIEVFVNAHYGYDVRCEVVGTRGTAALAPPRPPVVTRVDALEGMAVHRNYPEHFADAYRLELTAWVRNTAQGVVAGPSAWDGYITNLAADAGVRSLASGSWEALEPPERPAIYAA